jgi:hypothetical protein
VTKQLLNLPLLGVLACVHEAGGDVARGWRKSRRKSLGKNMESCEKEVSCIESVISLPKIRWCLLGVLFSPFEVESSLVWLYSVSGFLLRSCRCLDFW